MTATETLRIELQNFFGDKYTTWSNLTNDNYDELVDAGLEQVCEIRIADHSCRTANLDKNQSDVVLSFVVCDTNATEGRMSFDYLREWNISEMSVEQAKAFIFDRVREFFGPVLSRQDRRGDYCNIMD